MNHLRQETIFGYEHGLLLPDELRVVHDHIDTCESCRTLLAARMGALQMTAQVQHALASAEAPATPPSAWRHYAVAACVLVALAASWLWMRGAKPAEPELAAIRLPDFLAELADEQRNLMGGSAPGDRLLSPRATAVLGPNVTFTWTPLEGTSWRYVVRVFQLDDQPVVASAELVESRWTAPLAPGVSYQWQVTATRAGAEPVTLPGPSARPPRFRVLATVAVPQGDSLRRGIAYANAGLIDEARRELREAAQRDPRATTLLEQLNRPR